MAEYRKILLASRHYFVKIAIVKRLAPPDTHHLSAAQGWFELGKHLEANEELENISPVMRVHPDVLEIRWQILAKEKKWEICADIAQAITKSAPRRAIGWIYHAEALHTLNFTQKAYASLAEIAARFPAEWKIPYRLACFCSQLGRFDEAKTWFKKAMLLNEKTVRKLALDDPELAPLWDSMSTTVWRLTD